MSRGGVPGRATGLRRRAGAATGLGLAATLAPAGPAAAAEMVLTPSADASLYSESGQGASLADGRGQFLWVSTTAQGLARRAVIRFDLSVLPAGSVVTGVSLSLYESRSRTDHAVGLHRLTQGWTEGATDSGSAGAGAPASAGDVTWLSRTHPGVPWSTPGATHLAQASATTLVGFPNQRYTWGSTAAMVSDVQDWIDDPSTNHGWILIGDETTQQSAKRFESRENTALSNRPTLTVQFDPGQLANPGEGDVPLPIGLTALLGAALGFAVSARRRQSSTPQPDAIRR